MRFDDDDLEDYDGGYEDDKAVEDVLALVPSASEDDAWDALEKYDFDVDAAVAHLKSKLKPKVAPKPAPKAATPVQKPQQKQEEKPQNTQGKSKLQQLALKKQSGTKGDALSRLRNRNEPSEPQSALARLLAKKKSKNSPSPQPEQAQTPSSESISTTSSKLSTPDPSVVLPEISQEETPHIDRPTPSLFGSILGFSVLRVPKCLVSNAVNTPAAAAKNFAQPSPDDKVKNAQDSAFKKPPQPTESVAVKKSLKTKAKDLAAIEKLSLKPSISFVVIGHVDAGKSTLMGRLLVDAGVVSKKTIDKHKREAEKIGKSSFALAWVMDATTEERSRGVTVDVGESSFETTSTKFTVVDAPGHKDYVPNMIAGVSQADVAVLVVDSDTNAFESGFSLDGQTKEHAILARSLGIDSMVVAVNKLDTQDWCEERFEEIQTQLTEFLTKIVGFAHAKLHFVPTSGQNGDYVMNTSTAAPWYKGPTLVEALETLEVRQRDVSQPFRLVCSNVFQEDFQPHTTVVGRVVSGAIEKDDPIINCSENDVSGTVKSINGEKEYAVAGDVTELKLDITTDQCHPGDVLCAPEGVLNTVNEFTAKVILFDLKRPVLVGAKLSFYLGRVNQSIKIKKIVGIFDKKGEIIKKNPRHLTKGQAARVVFCLDQSVVLTPFAEVRDLGRFVLRVDGSTIGGGVIESVN